MEQETKLAKFAPIILSFFLGGILGHFFYSVTVGQPIVVAAPPAGGPGGGGGGGGGARAGGGGGGGGARPGGKPSSAMILPMVVHNLSTLQKAQSKGLTAEQTQKVLATLQEIKSADKLPEKECDAKLKALEDALNEDQKKVLADLSPMGGGMGMGGGGGRPDPERPFASDANKKTLTELIAVLQGGAK